MTINRLKNYPARLDFKAPLKYDVLKSDRVEHTTFVTIIHHDLGNSKNEISSSWSNEIFSYITENLKEVKGIVKIIINVSQKDIIRIWSVIKKENKKISKQIYKKEIPILDYLSNFNYDIDFHVVTEDMAKHMIDEDSRIVFDVDKVK